jgi:hypothetical protein
MDADEHVSDIIVPIIGSYFKLHSQPSVAV